MKEYETIVMKSILSRVLSTEIGNQIKWQKDDPEKLRNDRQELINIIRKYMMENDIEIRDDYILQ